MHGSVVDTAVGLPYLNVKLSPAPYSQHPLFVAAGSQSSCFVPRVYHLSIGIEVDVARAPATRAQPSSSSQHVDPLSSPPGHTATNTTLGHARVFQRCFAVTYTHILVLDSPSATANIISARVDENTTFAEVGGIHAVPLAREGEGDENSEALQGLLLSEEDPTWFTLQRGPSRRDIVLQLPVQIEATTFLKCLTVLFQHHRGRDLPVSVVDSTDELRHRAHMSSKSKQLLLQEEQDAGGGSNAARKALKASGLIPRQLWSVSNLDVPFVHDRMSFVKDTFAAVEKETKADLAELERNMHTAMRKIDLRLDQQRSKTEEYERLQRSQAEREASIAALQQELADTQQQVQEAQQKHDRLKMSFVEEAQSWRDVFQQRLSEELKKRQRLAHLQERRAKNVEQGKADHSSLEEKIALFSSRIAQYESDEYLGLVKERDAAMAHVKQLTAELAALKTESGYQLPSAQARGGGSMTPSPSRSTSRASRSVSSLTTTTIGDRGFDTEALTTNMKLRQMLDQCRIEIAEQDVHQQALQEDLLGFSNECVALQEEELLFDCQLKQQQARLHHVLSAATATNQLIEKQRELIGELKALPRFYIERQRLKAAVSRRSVLETEVDKAKAAQVAAINMLQQEVFAEKIRVLGLVQQQQQQSPNERSKN